MSRVNLHTWTRVTRLDLLNLSVGIGNAAMSSFRYWPKTGEGRAVKAATEKITMLLDRTLDRSDLNHAFDNLATVVSLFKEIYENGFYKKHIAQRKYVNRHGEIQKFSEALENRIQTFDKFVAENRPARKAVIHPADQQERMAGAKTPLSADDLAQKLNEVAPQQQSGPLQFEFDDGVLRLKRQVSEARAEDEKNIRLARAALEEESVALLRSLSESNCDPRLLEVVEEVKGIIESGSDVIRLGLVNFTCGHLFSRFQNELPDVAAARFLGFSVGIGLYVGQFPEWLRFVENAAQSEFEVRDVDQAYEIGKTLLPALREAKALVDPEVPKSVELILEALRNPKLSAKRALFGAVRTLENLLAKVFTELFAYVGALSEGGRSGVKRAATVIVASSLLVAAADVAVKLSPTAERVAKAGWMKKAGELVRKALED